MSIEEKLDLEEINKALSKKRAKKESNGLMKLSKKVCF
jgi:hypothetical protein